MFLQRFYDDQLAQASYLLGCAATGEALVVDPARDVAQYVEAAKREGLRVTHVTETHIHADFVSGARELAAAAGAQLLQRPPARGRPLPARSSCSPRRAGRSGSTRTRRRTGPRCCATATCFAWATCAWR